MPAVVKTKIVKIGNSQGVRIPKLFLEQTSLGKEVELELDREQIIIRPAHPARYNWEEAFRLMAEQGDDILLDGDILIPTAWEEEEWEW